jgi:SAM-dependent methyltransferase
MNNTEEYKKYKNVQIESHNKYRYQPENRSREGKRLEISNRILIDMVKKLEVKGRALDIGCAEGFHTEDLKNILGDANGIDINTESINIANGFGRNYCKEGDMHDLKFNNQYFDLVFAHESLEHSFDFDKAISEIHRVLKTDGYLVFSVPCSETNGKPTEEPHCSVMMPDNVWGKMLEHNFKIIGGAIYNIPLYNQGLPWVSYKMNYGFYPHLHAIVQKI